ncbi:hypothetical protein V6N13_067113 [Hibiscus sabdariffa]
MFKDRWGGDKQIQFSCAYGDNSPDSIKCKEFMMPGGEEWDTRKVRQVFNEVDANAILNCPINPVHEDIQAWGLHTSGVYSVKSGMVVDYDQLLSTDFLNAQEIGSSSNGNTMQENWSKPSQNGIKINVDGAFNPTTRRRRVLSRRELEWPSPMAGHRSCLKEILATLWPSWKGGS